MAGAYDTEQQRMIDRINGYKNDLTYRSTDYLDPCFAMFEQNEKI